MAGINRSPTAKTDPTLKIAVQFSNPIFSRNRALLNKHLERQAAEKGQKEVELKRQNAREEIKKKNVEEATRLLALLRAKEKLDEENRSGDSSSQSRVASRNQGSTTSSDTTGKQNSTRRLPNVAENKFAVAVIIGNKNYARGVPEVSFAHNDADAMHNYVVEHLGYREGNVIDLRDATQAQMLALFGSQNTEKGRLYSLVRPGRSDVTIFYSGHGIPGLESRKGYLLPVDANPNLVQINGYSIDLLFANLGKIKAKSMTVYFDACFSGDSPNGVLVKSASGVSVYPKLPGHIDGMTVITAAAGDQLASWDLDAKMGLFTKHLLTALRGKADGRDYGNGDGKISLSEVKKYLDDEMTYQARRKYNRRQRISVIGNPDTILVRK